jgi:2,3-bisphosphoglycerate-independent phosphoglycerate mutase
VKYAVLIGDGMADYPVAELNGRTPLQVAKIPNMNFVAQNGCVGMTSNVPRGMHPGSDVAIMSILGYDPRKHYTGRGPLEAASMGIKLGEGDIAFRCNLTTVEGDVMMDYSAGHISTKEAGVIIEFLNEKLGNEHIRFYPGVSYRHLLVVKSGGSLANVKCVPPHDITGKSVSRNLPAGDSSEFVIDLMERSKAILKEHEINRVRIDLGENPANMIWLWGQGSAPNIPLFRERYSLKGAVICAVDLVKGIGRIVGLDIIDVPGATGYYDTNFLGKANAAIDALKKFDFVCVHVEAPDEASHNGDLRAKITAIENFDSMVVGPVIKHFRKSRNYRILVMTDHTTPLSVRTHTSEPVCFGMMGKDVQRNGIAEFNEVSAARSGLKFEEGYQLMGYFLGKVKST